ncbi:MAG TPA: hypothetical protein VFJ01_09685, partial [Oleiagrimonas sp.]|nr:hypothetical protein [Oleiagrimonas sp.]
TEGRFVQAMNLVPFVSIQVCVSHVQLCMCAGCHTQDPPAELMLYFVVEHHRSAKKTAGYERLSTWCA